MRLLRRLSLHHEAAPVLHQHMALVTQFGPDDRSVPTITGVPYVDDASFTNALALLLTPVLRPAIDGQGPPARSRQGKADA